MKRLPFYFALACLLFATGTWAQYRNVPASAQNNGSFGLSSISTMGMGTPLKLSGLLDVSKLQMHHQFSSGFSSGGNGKSLSALYLNTMSYQVSPNVQWIAALGYGGTMMNSLPNGQTGGSPACMVGVQWKPAKNWLFSASFGHNMGTSPMGMGYSPFGSVGFDPYSSRDDMMPDGTILPR